jgi:hypothetical protein
MQARAAQERLGDGLVLPSPQRLLALLLVVIGHGLLIYLLATYGHSAPTEANDQFRSVRIYLTPIVEAEQEAPPKTDVTALTLRPKYPSKDSPAITLLVPQPVPSVNSAPPDWAREAHEAAQRMTQSTAPRRGFGKPPVDAVVTDKPPVGIFERESQHHAGDIEMIAPGVERRWYSENCFQEFGHLPELFPAPGLRTNPVRCMTGRRKADGALFEHLKPGYLKQKK